MILYELYIGRDYRIVPTLERIQKAVEHTGLERLPYVSFQVGGTNGKGSTCAFLEGILRYHGYKTGWFVSPHLVEEEERWRINGQKMPSAKLEYYVKELKSVFERFELTYFEACTLIALEYFKDERVDVAVFEVGMGGRWDATKVCNPSVCVITNVERDHTKWLGADVENRAIEKLGIYRKGVPLILGSMKFPLYTKALEMCDEKDLVVGGLDFFSYGRVSREKTVIQEYLWRDIHLEDAVLGLWGRWQIGNASLAITAAGSLLKLNTDTLKEALRQTYWEGRMEIVRKAPLLILDGAHNTDSIKKVVREVKKYIGNITPVFTGLKDKEWKESMSFLRELSERIYVVQINHRRGEELEHLEKHAKNVGFREVIPLLSSDEVHCIEEDLLVIGSLYLVGEVKSTLEKARKP
jgi:dihydrofolate synthase/folylpolyglutamate synthase